MGNSRNFITLEESLEALTKFFIGDNYSINQYMNEDNTLIHKNLIDHIIDIYNDTVGITYKICRISLITNVILGIILLLSSCVNTFCK